MSGMTIIWVLIIVALLLKPSLGALVFLGFLLWLFFNRR